MRIVKLFHPKPKRDKKFEHEAFKIDPFEHSAHTPRGTDKPKPE